MGPGLRRPPGVAHASRSACDRETAAYYARIPDAFLSFYAPDAELFEFPDKSLAKGKEALRKRFEPRFAEPNLHTRPSSAGW